MIKSKNTVVRRGKIVILARNVDKYYSNFHALKGISFELKKGEILGFLGPNGAGKTTTMRILTTFLPLTSGEITINGYDLIKKPMEIRKLIGYLPETPPLYPEFRVTEYLDFVARIKGISRNVDKTVDRIIDRCGLGEKKHSLIAHLSKGYRQRVGLAQALIHNPGLLILDEPTSGLDPQQILEIRDFIRELGCEHSIILSTHILPEASQLCHRVLIIDHGRIIASGSQQELNALARGGERVKIRINEPLAAMNSIRSDSFSASIEDGVLVLDGEFGDEGRAGIVSTLVGAGFRIYSVESEQLNLEQVFITLLRNAKNV
ncbi:MAG: ABC transporter ATP-binding protein [Candidatus Wallbacteria bacterium]|nr:ABC transporter ATP-binding protein [Candidatus Wallbacteria bacterium]